MFFVFLENKVNLRIGIATLRGINHFVAFRVKMDPAPPFTVAPV